MVLFDIPQHRNMQMSIKQSFFFLASGVRPKIPETVRPGDGSNDNDATNFFRLVGVYTIV